MQRADRRRGGTQQQRGRPWSTSMLPLLLLVLLASSSAAAAQSAGASDVCTAPAGWWRAPPSAATSHKLSSSGSGDFAGGSSSSRSSITVVGGDFTSSSACSSSSGGHAADDLGTCMNSGDEGEEEEDGGRYIVRFHGYEPADALRARIARALGPEGAPMAATAAGGSDGGGSSSSSSSIEWRWRWVPRFNAAAGRPTDFGLVSLAPDGPAAAASAAALLARALGPSFRGLHADRKFSARAALLRADADALSADGGSGDSEQQERRRQRRRRRLHGNGDGHADGATRPTGAPPPAPSPAAPTHPAPSPAPAAGANGSGGSGSSGASGSGSGGGTDDILRVQKRPGRFSTRPTIGLDPDDPTARESASELKRRLARRRRRRDLKQDEDAAAAAAPSGGAGAGANGVAALLRAKELWDKGFTGAGVRVGVFDTGIREGHPHIRRIKERTNWTHQNSLADGLGHGTFVAGVIAGSGDECPGLAPDVELVTFKVFTDDQVSYTSWFLDAFNYAMEVGVHVINLSIGGPDYLDAPFVDKVREVTARGALMVSAIGNDGPLYGTLNNPADQADVIGVGGIGNDGAIASFSSRGMTTHELPAGTGRIKPDVMAYARDVPGSKIHSGCRTLSGTSVASPVVAGAVALLASTVPAEKRWALLNPASMKQALVEGSARLPGLNAYEQGSGRLDLAGAAAVLAAYEPRASLIPARLDFTDCPYLWPYCRQPLYAFGLPLAFNATVLNGLGPSGKFKGAPKFEPSDQGGKLLDVTFTYSDVLWPWSGFLGVFVEASPAAWNFTGAASGEVVFTIESPPPWGASEPRSSTVRAPLRVALIPTPPKARRVLWDQLHSVRYPPGYIPRDNLDVKSDILDWHGDHPATNYHEALDALVDAGYHVEILSSPATCVDLRNYGAYLVVDSEDEWYPEETAAVARAVQDHGLALLVFAEWYHAASLAVMRFFDDNTRSWWTPATGGANVPALNDLLGPLGVALGGAIVTGTARHGELELPVAYGTSIYKFPSGGAVYSATMSDVATRNAGGSDGGAAAAASGGGDEGDDGGVGSAANAPKAEHAVLGVARVGRGAVGVFGDSNCLDSSHRAADCRPLLLAMLSALAGGDDKAGLLSPPGGRLAEPYVAPHFSALPARRPGVNFTQYSWTLSHPLQCYANAPCASRGRRGIGGGEGGDAGSGEDKSACPEGPEWRHTWLEPGKEPRAAGAAAAAAAAAPGKSPHASGGDWLADGGSGGKGGDANDANRREPTAVPAQKPTQQQQQQPQPQPKPQQPSPSPSPPPVPQEQPQPQWHAGGLDDSAGIDSGSGSSSGRRAPLRQAVALGSAICIIGVAAVAVMWRARSGAAAAGSFPRVRYVELRRGGLVNGGGGGDLA